MKHSDSLLTPAQCLLRAILPIPQRPIASRSLLILRQPRANFSVCVSRHAKPFLSQKNVAGTENTGKYGSKANRPKYDILSDYIKDEDINAPDGVQMVQPDGKLAPVQSLMEVLRLVNRDEEHVVQVSPPNNHRPTAVVRILKRADLIKQKLDKQKTQQKQQRTMKDRAPKQIELNWAIGPHDLDIKLGQLESFLGKGKTVEIILAAKRKQRKANEEEGAEVLKKIRDKMGDIDGREVKPMEGQVLKQVVLTVRKREVD